MAKHPILQKVSLAAATLLIVSCLLPVWTFAASRTQLYYNTDTGRLSGVIVSDNASVRLSVYSDGKAYDIMQGISSAQFKGLYKFKVDTVLNGLNPEYVTIDDNGVQQAVYAQNYGFGELTIYDSALTFTPIENHKERIEWNAEDAPGLAGYKIYLDGKEVASVSSDADSYVLTDIQASKQYVVTVAGVDQNNRELFRYSDTFIYPGEFQSFTVNLDGKPAGYWLQPNDALVTFTPSVVDFAEPTKLYLSSPSVWQNDTTRSSIIERDRLSATDFVVEKPDRSVIPVTSIRIFGSDSISITLAEPLEAGKSYVLKMSPSSAGNEIQLPDVVTDKASFGLITMIHDLGDVLDQRFVSNIRIGTAGGSSRPGSGGRSGNGAPAVPVNTNPGEDNNGKRQVVSEEKLKANGSDRVKVDVADGAAEVELPVRAAELIGNKALELNGKEAGMVIPVEVLRQLQALLSAEERDGSHISVQMMKLPLQNVQRLLARTEDSSGAEVTAASEVYDFSLKVVTKNGTERKLAAFDKPVTLKLKFNAQTDRELLGVYHIGDNGELQYVGGKVDNGFLTADTRHFSTYTVLQWNKSFKDVPSAHWANRVVKVMAACHIVEGVNREMFMPSKAVTRAEFAALLARALNLNPAGPSVFSDVDSGKWYAQAVTAAYEAGIVNGRANGVFAPEESITREEMAVMAVRAYERMNQRKADSAGHADVSDRAEIGEWAQSSVDAAFGLGLITGRGEGRFVPKGVTTRAESAQIVYRLLEK